MSAIACCHNCEMRTGECHATCMIYAEEKQMNDKRTAKIKAEKDKQNALQSHIMQSYKRFTGKKLAEV